MNKFNVGDKVRQVTESESGSFNLDPDKTYTVREVTGRGTMRFRDMGILSYDVDRFELVPAQGTPKVTTKDTNPKDAVGIKKWRQFSCIPLTVLAEIGVALVEGARKYGRHNYRVAGVRSSVYVDASIGHIMQYWEGEDIDPDSNLSHITKAIASLIVLRDSMIQENIVDDRPPKGNLNAVRDNLQSIVDDLFIKYPDAKEAYTNAQR